MPRFDPVPFETRPPIDVRGGIRARSRWGAFGSSWWARRWLDVLEGFDLGGRLSRGRSYARRGQVLSIDVTRGTVTASVQGSRARPYLVTITTATLEKEEWDRLTAALTERLSLMAELLAGRMPDDIEDVFDEAGVSLFPGRRSDLETHCTCPDQANPCKHVAAVYLLLGEEFDRDPFLVFRLRGADRETFLATVNVQAVENVKEGGNAFPERPGVRAFDPLSQSEPLPKDPDQFWQGTSAGEASPMTAAVPMTSATLPKQLGVLPFWRGEEDFMAVLEHMYDRASQQGLKVHMGE